MEAAALSDGMPVPRLAVAAAAAAAAAAASSASSSTAGSHMTGGVTGLRNQFVQVLVQICVHRIGEQDFPPADALCDPDEHSIVPYTTYLAWLQMAALLYLANDMLLLSMFANVTTHNSTCCLCST